MGILLKTLLASLNFPGALGDLKQAFDVWIDIWKPFGLPCPQRAHTDAEVLSDHLKSRTFGVGLWPPSEEDMHDDKQPEMRERMSAFPSSGIGLLVEGCGFFATVGQLLSRFLSREFIYKNSFNQESKREPNIVAACLLLPICALVQSTFLILDRIYYSKLDTLFYLLVARKSNTLNASNDTSRQTKLSVSSRVAYKNTNRVESKQKLAKDSCQRYVELALHK